MFAGARAGAANTTPTIPPPADHKIDFHREVVPILAGSCVKCHANSRHEGGFNIENRESLVKGGDDGAVIVVGKSADSLLIKLVSGLDPDRVMPAKGPRLSTDQIGVLRAWIDQGATWESGFTFKRAPPAPLHLRHVALPAAAPGQTANPIDLLLSRYFAANHIPASDLATNVADDRTFIRRVSLDLIGLLPDPSTVEKFVADTSPDKRAKLVDHLLGEKKDYAEHWMTFWNDALRNAYRGPGYIDGGRTQISEWLYQALYNNTPYDEFVRELIDPKPDAAGFIRGIVWRGVVNASQVPEMQAAQNISQVFMGINLKCASCHDSFINDWTLNDSYGLAGVFSDKPLEVHRCDKPMGRFAPMKFLYPELGTIDPKAPRDQRLEQLARALTSRDDGRFARTIVNRLWSRMFGRGLVEPVDDMDQPAWNSDLLDWLAGDLVAHDFDLKHTLQIICNSRAYQMQSVGAASPSESGFVFRGPVVERMTAEQFVDAVCTVTDDWPKAAEFNPATPKPEQDGQKKPRAKSAADKAKPPAKPAADQKKPAPKKSRAKSQDHIRAVLMNDDALTRALGRTDRNQVMTHRDDLATTLQALELTNGKTLDDIVKQGAKNWIAKKPKSTADLVERIYERALCRAPTQKELDAATDFIGPELKPDGVEDFLWAVFMLPEFQLVH